VRRAQREARFREPAAPRGAHRQRDPEVGHHRLPALQQDVLGLDVPVHDPLLVRELQRRSHRLGDLHRFVDAELLVPPQPLAQGLALDERHHVIEERVGLSRIVQRQDVRVLQTGRHLDLVEKPLGAEDRHQLGAQDLHGDLAVVLEIVGQVDSRHPPFAHMSLQAVAVGESRRQAVGDVAGHLSKKIHGGDGVGEYRERVAAHRLGGDDVDLVERLGRRATRCGPARRRGGWRGAPA
jgi:hypothetical protein